MSTLREVDVLPQMTSSAHRLEQSSVFVLSAAALGVQVVWTRIFSYMIWYHFAFLVISVAMLGFTCGGLALQVLPRWLERGRDADVPLRHWFRPDGHDRSAGDPEHAVRCRCPRQ